MQVGVGYAKRTMTLHTTLLALAKASNSWVPTLSKSISLLVLARQPWTTCPLKSEPASPEKSSMPPSLPVARSSKPPLPPIPSFRCISKSTTKNNVGINRFAPRFFLFQIKFFFQSSLFPPFLPFPKTFPFKKGKGRTISCLSSLFLSLPLFLFYILKTNTPTDHGI